MIGYLKGQCLSFDSENVLVDVGGVGYEVFCSANTIAEISQQSQSQVIFWIYTHVREDQLQLFGFLHKEEKNLFLSLLKVNGIGPKLAMNVFSGGTYSHIVDMIENGDAKGLSSLPKVGKKTAEQIILTLQGKLVRVDDIKKKSVPRFSEISSALLNLGFKSQLVDEYISTLPEGTTLEDGVRKALSQLGQI